ncbi:MAG: right-handed parallel beta-helix repeat-containing protein [Pirellulales bacterium]|nr:right-handed parallel beta-helix repeat-containing protein [Pirellulales bacterium]
MRSRMAVEPLEQRLLLSLSPAAITSAQRQTILDGLDGLRDWADSFNRYAQMASQLPVVGQSLGATLDVAGALAEGLIEPVTAYFAGDSTPTTDELVDALKNLSGSIDDLTVTVNPANVSGGWDSAPGNGELVFNLVFQAERTRSSKISLGPEGDARRFFFDSSIAADFHTAMTLDFALGVDLTAGLSAAEAFFVRDNQFQISGDANVAALATGGMNTGFWDAQLASGSMSLSAALGIGLANPDADPQGRITLEEIEQTALANLVSLTPSGSASGNIGVSAGSFAGFTPVGPLTASFSTTNPFEPPVISFSGGFTELLKFTNLDPSSLLGALGDVGDWLEQTRGTSVLSQALHLIGSNLGDAVQPEQLLKDPVGGLVALLLTPDRLPNFDSAQGFAASLAAALGVPPSAIAPAYNETSHELTFQVAIEKTVLDRTLPLSLDLNLSPLGSFQAASTVHFDTHAAMDFTLGFDLSGLTAEMLAAADGPADGKLAADANFLLTFGAAAPVAVTVAKTATNNNAALDDLVADIDAALAAAKLSGKVAAGRDGNRLKLIAAGPAPSVLLRFDAEAGNPALTELKFQDDAQVGDSVLAHVFLEGASLSADATLDVSDLDMVARLGFLRVAVDNGTGSASVGAELQLKSPGAPNPGGRLTLTQLFDALRTDITAIVAPPQLTGDLDLHVPLQVTPNILGSGHPLNPSLDVTWSYTETNPGSPSLQFNNADALLNFRGFDAGTITALLVSVAGYLNDLGAFSFLDAKIPGLSKSLGRIDAFVERFQQKAEYWASNPAAILQDVETALEDAFGLSDPALELTLEESNTVVKVALALENTANPQLPLNMELGGLGHLLDVHSTGNLSIVVGSRLDLDFGIDLTNPLDPKPFLYDTSQLALSLKAEGANIGFTTALGPLGVFVKNGSLLIDGDGSAATPNDRAELVARLEDDNADGKIYLSQLSLNHARLSLDGQVHATLPVYFPTANQFIGNIELTVGDLGDISNTTSLVAPDFNLEAATFDLLNNLGSLLTGVDFVLGGVQDFLQGDIFGVRLPMIGDGLKDAAQFVADLRENVVQELQRRFQESLGKTPEIVRNAIFDVLGPGGLDLLKDNDNSGTVTPADIAVVLSDKDSDGQNDDQIDIAMLLGKNLAAVNAPIGFDLGLPALSLDVAGNVQLLLGFEWKLAFGMNRELGFYFDTSQQDELTVNLEARIPDLKATGNLLWFQLEASDEDADGNPANVGVDVDLDGVLPSSFIAALKIDLLDPVQNPGDPDDDDKLTFEELAGGGFELDQVVHARLGGNADVNLNLLLSFRGDARFPSIAADLQVDWPFSLNDPTLQGGEPTVDFKNVRLNVGELLDDFAGPLLKKVRKATEPLEPIAEFLTSPIPILENFGIKATPLDLAEVFGYADAADYLETVAEIVNVINGIPNVSHDAYVPLGAFQLDGDDPRTAKNLDNFLVQVTQTVDPQQELPAVSPQASGFLGDLHDLGISLPIIESPSQIFKLLMGRTADLFLFDMPDLDVRFPFPPIVIGPLIPPIPIFATFGGSIEAKIDLKFGFDTYGFQKYQDTGDWLDIFDGFYLSDRKNADGTGKDVPEATLTGEVHAGLELNLAVVSAGVSGGVAMNLYANLNDPDNDGRVHLDEFLENLDLGPFCTFDVSGDVVARLSAYVRLLFVRKDYPLVEVQIADFNLTDEDRFPDRFQGNHAQGSATPLGVGPGLHVDGMSIHSANEEDWYSFELLRPDSVDVDVRYTRVHGNIDLEVYDAQGVKLGESKTDKDRDLVSLINVPAGTYFLRVLGSSQKNNYRVAVEPGAASNTRVIYVNPAGKTNFDDSYYTSEPGNDAYDGLLYRRPKASLQSVLDAYDLGPNDLIALDTGVHAAGALILAADEGATYVGTLAGSNISGITVNDADNNLFDRLRWSGAATGLLISGDGVADAEGNLIRRGVLGAVPTAIRIESARPNTVENNASSGSGGTGIYLAANVPALVRNNDISGRATGIYSDSQVADVYANAIHDNAVGMESRRGILGPDNSPPVGSPAAKAYNDVYANQTGVLIPDDASGPIVRFTKIRNNNVGIEVLGHDAQILANEIYGNQIGVRGTEAIGPAEWTSELYNVIRNNATGVWALSGAEVRYNRIYANATGVRLESHARLRNNLIYRNTGDGVLVEDARNAEAFNNTIYAPAGNGVKLLGDYAGVKIENNIIWAASGYAIYVGANGSEDFDSDYNNLYATGSGKIAFQGKDFTDLYDWQAEAESDLHSIGTTALAPTLDDPLFANLAGDDYRLQSGSTSNDAGNPAADYAFEPSPNGNRVDLGAYGNTPLATVSPAAYLKLEAPVFYADLVPSRSYEIRWSSYGLPGGVDMVIELLQEGVGLVDVVDVVSAASGTTTWTPGNFTAGGVANRYRLRLTTLGGPSLSAQSREPFAIVAPGSAFFVDDASDASDQYTPTAVGNNRNTGTTAGDPKAAIRPILLSYDLDAGDEVRVDTGNYVQAVNLNLSSAPLAMDPRMRTATAAAIVGPSDWGDPNKIAWITRANAHAGATVIDFIDADDMDLKFMTLVGAETGVLVRQGSANFFGDRLVLNDHARDGFVVEDSPNAVLDHFTVHDNGRHGLVIESISAQLLNSEIYANAETGAVLRDVGAAVVETTEIYANRAGLDIINPGASTAVIGRAALDDYRGNLVHDNAELGIFASGKVLVAGNTVWQNGALGIRLDDGADASRNSVRLHAIGISALNSTSDIGENRSYLNADAGIVASLDSHIWRNITYSNQVNGIRVDRYSGRMEHNVVYETGFNSIKVEGAALGAELIHNTVYEPCAMNVRETTVDLKWTWPFTMQQFNPWQWYNGTLQGPAEVVFQAPVGLGFGGTFDLGLGGSLNALTPVPVPPGQQWLINIEIVALNLSAVNVPGLGPATVTLDPTRPSVGQLVVEEVGGFLQGTSFFDVFVQFHFPQHGLELENQTPIHLAGSFGPSANFNPFQSLQVPFLTAQPGGSAMLVDPRLPPPQPAWGQFSPYSMTPAASSYPSPQDQGQTCAEIGVWITNNSRHVLLRNNIIYVEGHDLPPLSPNTHNLVVDADSTLGWESDFDALSTLYGNIGSWAGTTAVTLTDWQNLSNDDFLSISPALNELWVDPDGLDDLLAETNGFDDNFHLRSPYGYVVEGAIAPIEDNSGPTPTFLPYFQTVLYAADPAPDPNDLSPAVDAGDPAYSYAIEPSENGRMANLGAYGYTVQASLSPPEYVHIVSPIGRDEWVQGRTYNIRWRSQDSLGTVDIGLYHGSAYGTLETSIMFAAPNTGSFLWVVPAFVASASDYVVVVSRPSILGPDPVVGESRRTFSIGPDFTPPAVIDTSPQIVDWEQSTNFTVTWITLVFQETLSPATVLLPSSYELLSAGGNQIFGDGDDALVPFSVTYTPGSNDSNSSLVRLTSTAGSLATGRYRLSVFSSAIGDSVGNALDGDGDGVAGGDYVREFRIDKVPPTVGIAGVAPDPRNSPVDEIEIIFSEEVGGLGHSDLALTCDGGVNLLTREQTLYSADGIHWTLGNLAALTAKGGQYTLSLSTVNADIRDPAYNLLASGASDSWIVDVAAPTLEIVAVTPDPRTGSIAQISLVFSEAVGGVSLGNLAFTLDGGANLLPGAATLSTTDNITWTLDNLSGISVAKGLYALRLAAGHGITDLAGNPLGNDPTETWIVDVAPPTVGISPVSPKPRNAPVAEVFIQFDEPVSGIDPNDFSLTLNGGLNLLTGAESLSSVDGIHWKLGNLSALTAAAGNYTLTLNAAGAGIVDAAGNPLALGTAESWTVDLAPPTVAITPVAPNPRQTPLGQIQIVFNEAVTGPTLAHLSLTRNGGGNLLTAAQTLSTSDNVNWTLGNLSGLTNLGGNYVLTLTAATAIKDLAGNPLPSGAVENWSQDLVAPTVAIAPVAPNPRNTPVAAIHIVFSEPVAGPDLGDIVLSLDGGANLLPGGATLDTSDNITWILGNLGPLTNRPGTYGIAITALGSAIADATGNLLPAGATETWLVPGPLTYTWDGGGADNLWTTVANWVGDLAPLPGDNLVFPAGAARLSNIDDYPPGTIFNSIVVSGGNYQFQTNPIRSATVAVQGNAALTAVSIVCDALTIDTAAGAAASAAAASFADEPSALSFAMSFSNRDDSSAFAAASLPLKTDAPESKPSAVPVILRAASRPAIALVSEMAKPTDARNGEPLFTRIAAAEHIAGAFRANRDSVEKTALARPSVFIERLIDSIYRETADFHPGMQHQSPLAETAIDQARGLALQSLVKEHRGAFTAAQENNVELFVGKPFRKPDKLVKKAIDELCTGLVGQTTREKSLVDY